LLKKLNRNTLTASLAASEKAAVRRKEVREELRIKVFYEWCKCGRCKSGDYSHLCLSYREIANTANTLRVPTIRHKEGTWKPAMVSNLFQEMKTKRETETVSLFDID
tara:strand:- start:152 stop:472 length:321 start_codon:yes stop_codon:yes gene_type:complete